MATNSLMSLLAGMHWDDQVKFAEAIETIKTAASMLSRPEVVACLAFLKETSHAAGSIQATMQNGAADGFASSTDAVAATMLYEAVNVVPIQDAVKAVAVQDNVKAVALQHAVKTIALREASKSDTFSEEEIRAIVSDEAARAIALLRHSESGSHFVNERRSQHDRRKHH